MPNGAAVPTSPWLWGSFGALVFVMLAIDLGVFHRRAHEVRKREALAWSVVWVALALLFNAAIYHWRGPVPAGEFLASYVLEKSLSVDNLFVFLVIFNYFHLSAQFQHRVLYWGILGALVMRAVFIALGTTLLHHFHWVMYVFGGLLLITAVKLCMEQEEEPDISDHFVIRLCRRLFRVTDTYDGGSFFVTKDGVRWATPLFVVLVVIEFSDVMFAVDSIPAVLAITQDPFIVYTSNVFAILGLRALYFLLHGVMAQFVYLRYGLAVILGFVGVKMLLVDTYKIPIGASLAVIFGVLTATIVASLTVGRRRAEAAAAAAHAVGAGGGSIAAPAAG
ncbi:MAG: TerC family protein, partial [Planctomycetes bacterium]|nr:TerC family protein [Planctomycetota bacterium]